MTNVVLKLKIMKIYARQEETGAVGRVSVGQHMSRAYR